jgi:glyoxylase-like metal-dependent hydrolase (beta-lactamase superfamily II)
MKISPNIHEVPEMSPDPRLRVFRRTMTELDEFAGMQVDAYVLLGEHSVVLLDTLLCPNDVAVILDAIRPTQNLRHLFCVNSHADFDHSWGNAFFADHHVPIVAHEACRARLLSPEAKAELSAYQARSPLFQRVSLVAPTLTFGSTWTLYDPAWTLQLLHARGHSPDHLVAWLPELRILLAFDALESPLPSMENAAEMFSTLEYLATLDAAQVLCSHSSSTSPALIQENLAYLREIRRRAELAFERELPKLGSDRQAAAWLGYPFEEVLAQANVKEDYAYYREAHEQNVRAVVRSLAKRR